MFNIIKQKIEMEKGLNRKLEFICDFCNTTPTIINGSVYYYYYCHDCKCTIKEDIIKKYISEFINNIVEYDSVVNQSFYQ